MLSNDKNSTISPVEKRPKTNGFFSNFVSASVIYEHGGFNRDDEATIFTESGFIGYERNLVNSRHEIKIPSTTIRKQ